MDEMRKITFKIRAGCLLSTVIIIFILVSSHFSISALALDSDNDGLPDDEEAMWACDPNNWDSDGDGMPDGWEVDHGLIPFSKDGNVDSDVDGLTNLEEYSYAIPITWNVSVDGVWWNGTAPYDPDTDNDTLSDGWEVLYSLDPRDNGEYMWEWNSTLEFYVQNATVGNIINGKNGDPDIDGANNSQESSYGINPRNWDSDIDGIPDGWEIVNGLVPSIFDANNDRDGDTLTNLDEYNYSKPISWDESIDGVWWGGINPNDRDTDNDTMPDDWEIDYGLNPSDNGTLDSNDGTSGDPDNDYLTNGDEFIHGTSPIDDDSDNDGMPDGWEVNYSLMPTVEGDKNYDPDSDGLTNLQEYLSGTNPKNDDTDNDGVSDASDDFPLDPNESMDTDNDGIGNNADTDDDGDDVPDISDDFPLDPNENVDTDNDGIGNNADIDDDGDGVSDVQDDFPLNPAESTDTDDDGIGNNADTDDDGDGVPDVSDEFPLNPTEYLDTDGDGIGNNADTDDDGDGIPDVQDDFPQNPAEYLDTDGDGIGNNADTDDDGDGVPDADDFAPLDPTITTDTIPPVADASLNQVVNEGTLVTFVGSDSTDNVNIINYTWTFTYNGSVMTVYGVSPQFVFWTSGNYTVTLKVTDTSGNSDTDTMTLTVEESGGNDASVDNTGNYGWVIIPIVIIIFTVIGGMAYAIKRKPKRPIPPSE